MCVDPKALESEFAGREYDRDFLEDLRGARTPCGENGEFHPFIYDGPIFSTPVVARRGEKVHRENRFYCCDLI